MFVRRVCVKVSDDFAVDDRYVEIQKGSGCERTVAREFMVGWRPLRKVMKASRSSNGLSVSISVRCHLSKATIC